MIGTARHWSRVVGAEGLIMLTVSLLLIGLTGGLSLLLVIRHVTAAGRRVPTTIAAPATVVVAGKALRRGAIDEDYRARLERARRLHEKGLAPRIVLLGGRRDGGEVSEARLGRHELLAQGVGEAHIVVEESSRHTLENLIELRGLLPGIGPERLAFVSSRYHLARCAAMARQLGLPLELCAAEPRWTGGPRTVLRVVREALLLHWYEVGRFLSRRLHYRRALARIT